MITRFFLALIAGCLLPAVPARAENTNLTIGFATADFTAAKAAGFEFAEVRIREFMKLSDEGFVKYTTNCRATGLSLTTGYWFLPTELNVVGPDVHLEAITNYLVKALDRCQTLGVKIIVWGSGDARRAPEGFAKEKAFDQLVALAKWVAPEAKKRGIMIGAEPLRAAEANTINTTAEGLQWVEAVNHPNFQLIVDIFHMTEEHEDAAIIVKAGPHIVHIHMSNPHDRVFPLHADEFDYTPFFKALHQIGYHGTCTIEAKTTNLAKEGPEAIEFIRSAYAAASANHGNEK